MGFHWLGLRSITRADWFSLAMPKHERDLIRVTWIGVADNLVNNTILQLSSPILSVDTLFAETKSGSGESKYFVVCKRSICSYYAGVLLKKLACGTFSTTWWMVLT